MHYPIRPDGFRFCRTRRIPLAWIRTCALTGGGKDAKPTLELEAVGRRRRFQASRVARRFAANRPPWDSRRWRLTASLLGQKFIEKKVEKIRFPQRTAPLQCHPIESPNLCLIPSALPLRQRAQLTEHWPVIRQGLNHRRRGEYCRHCHSDPKWYEVLGLHAVITDGAYQLTVETMQPSPLTFAGRRGRASFSEKRALTPVFMPPNIWRAIVLIPTG
jgi:hypothetical protein